MPGADEATRPGRSAVNASMPRVWAGIECSMVRIGDEWRDQIRETGHFERADDLDRTAALGIRVLRYPVLWEHVAPDHPERLDWRWHDHRMERMRHLGISPIVGLVHHGSGPAYTDLLDPAFPQKLAAFADKVAARYPWARDWTPVNEPVTTARFAGLYGHWYPHHRDLGSFCRMVVNQCRGTALAMRAIRRHIPDARLIQTEDMGCVFATPDLQYQADHENDRRWLSFDLLCGHVDRSHPFLPLLRDAGISDADLDELRSGEAAPDILGINHYLTSERYLDHAQDAYPPHFMAGNGQEAYADVEAVRIVPSPGALGPRARLSEVWHRYRRPVAVTEAHHGCPEEVECLRWLNEVWTAACDLRTEGADIRAVTVWALFGSMDWRSLLRERAGAYEPGAFDARHYPPRRTMMAEAVASLVRTGSIGDARAHQPGWWKRPERIYQRP